MTLGSDIEMAEVNATTRQLCMEATRAMKKKIKKEEEKKENVQCTQENICV